MYELLGRRLTGAFRGGESRARLVQVLRIRLRQLALLGRHLAGALGRRQRRLRDGELLGRRAAGLLGDRERRAGLAQFLCVLLDQLGLLHRLAISLEASHALRHELFGRRLDHGRGDRR